MCGCFERQAAAEAASAAAVSSSQLALRAQAAKSYKLRLAQRLFRLPHGGVGVDQACAH